MFINIIVWVQVLGEMLPISSSTQVDLMMRWWGLSAGLIPKGFDYVLHIPVLFVVPLFFKKSWSFFFTILCARLSRRELCFAWSTRAALIIVGKLLGIIFCSGLIAAATEFLFKDLSFFFHARSLGLLVTAGLLLAVAFYRSSWIKDSSPWFVLCLVGIAQGCALVPGISRMGVTVCVALLCGMTVRRAFEFSFALQLPLIAAACLLRGLPWLFSQEAGVWVSMGVVMHLMAAGIVSYFVLWGAQIIFEKNWSWIFAGYVLACAVARFFF